MSLRNRVSRLETSLATCAASESAVKLRRLMELIATGTLRRRGVVSPDVSRLSESELLATIGAPSLEVFERVVRDFAVWYRQKKGVAV